MKRINALSSVATVALGVMLLVYGVMDGVDRSWPLLLSGVMVTHSGYRLIVSDLGWLWSRERP